MEHLRKTEIRLDDLMLPYRIDLVIYAEIKEQALKDHIDRVGIILYRSGD